MDFGVDVERVRAVGCPCIDLEKGLLLMGKFCAKVPQARAQHGTHIFDLSLEERPACQLSLPIAQLLRLASLRASLRTTAESRRR